MQSFSRSSFKQNLDNNHSWPCTYMFKFIVPEQKSNYLMDLFEPRDEINTRKSRNGKYVSVTARCKVQSSEEVLAVYEAASKIKGILSL